MGGVNSAIQRGLEEVKKICNIHDIDNLISYCDCDDIWARNKLNIQIDYMTKNPECGLSYHDMAQIDENGALTNSSILHGSYNKDESFLCVSTLYNHIIYTEMMFRANLIDNILPLPLGFGMFQDHWTVLVLSLLDVNIQYINQQLGYYRRGHDSLMKIMRNTDLIKSQETGLKYLYSLKKNFPDRDISYEIQYNEDKLDMYNKKYPKFMIYLFMMFNYPKTFLLYLKAFIYEKVLYKIIK